MKHSSTPTPVLIDTKDAIGLLVAFTLAATLMGGWYFWYVQPREDFLLAVAECTGADLSEAAWKRCSEQVRAEIVQ